MRIIQGIIVFIFATFVIAMSLVGQEEKEDIINLLHKWKIPENFILNNDSKIFKPVKFNHEMHAEIMSDCKICHHNSIEGQYPACKTCHGKPFDSKNSKILGTKVNRSGILKSGLMKFFEFDYLERPGLKGAYHNRCMGCHKEYDSGPVGCTECHEKKESQ